MKAFKICGITTCSYPVGECSGECYHPDERRMDVIGQNGNDGYHYQFCPPDAASMPTDLPTASYVRLVAMHNGGLLMDYHAGWDGSVDVLRRARALIDSLIEEAGK